MNIQLKIFIVALILGFGSCSVGKGKSLEETQIIETEKISKTEKGASLIEEEKAKIIADKKSTKKDVIKFRDFNRISRNKIELILKVDYKNLKELHLYRRRLGDKKWKKLNTMKQIKQEKFSYIDILETKELAQYEYKAEFFKKGRKDKEGEDRFLASNLEICLDPGHFRNRNSIDDEIKYSEGEMTLLIGKGLEKRLKKDYGISSILTRTGPDIVIGGYKNFELDSKKLSLRGEFAKNSDFFISLHTNANGVNANGYPTISQHFSLNKPIIIANTIVIKDKAYLNVANEIGKALAKESYREGVLKSDQFEEAKVSEVKEWTEKYNDGNGFSGKVVKRVSEDGSDYYGVLRGATKVGIPGIIIEHGHHTVLEVRKKLMDGSLKEAYINGDAEGIAKGFKFQKIGELKNE